MANRISDLNLFQNSIRNTATSRRLLIEAQTRVSTGRRINVPSDDPTGAAKTLALTRTLDQIDQLERNGSAAKSFLDNTEAALANLTDSLIRLRELSVANSGPNGPTATDDSEAISEVEQIYDEILSMSNTRVGGRYLFGGHATDAAPFTKAGNFVAGTPGPPPAVTYGGDSGVIDVQVNEASRLTINLDGRRVFFGSNDGDDIPDAGGVDIFQVVRDLRDNLLATGDPSVVIDELDSALDQVTDLRGELGGRQRRLELTTSQLENFKGTISDQRSLIQDVDFVAAISELTQQEQAFQAALGVTARVLQPSLLNFLG